MASFSWASMVVLVVKQTNKQTNKKQPICQCRRQVFNP